MHLAPFDYDTVAPAVPCGPHAGDSLQDNVARSEVRHLFKSMFSPESRRPFLTALAVFIGFFVCLGAQAQWATQSIALKPGWNAVYLELEPEPLECDVLFAGLPVESVWSWNKRFSSVQFVQDPDKLVPGQPEWLTWLPPAHPATTLVNLFTVSGGAPYLVKLRDDASPINWTVRGRPVVRNVDWVSDSFNFVGFAVADTSPPSLQSFFSGSPAHAGKPIYRLNAAGLWEQVTNPGGAAMRRGEAFWIRCDGRSTYSGPLGAILPEPLGLNYGRQLAEQNLRLKNQSSVARTFTLRTLTSQAAPGPTWATLAGPVPLSYFKIDLPNNSYGWVPLPTELTSPSLPPGGEWLVRLEVRRRDMLPFGGASGPAGNRYQTLLEITDGNGTRQSIGLTAHGLVVPTAVGQASPLQLADVISTPSPHVGLWVGNVVIQKVSQPSKIGQPETPLPVANPLQYRILIHVDAQGQARLIQKVLQVWKSGTLKPDPDDPTKNIDDQPGRFVLLTNEQLLPNFSGSTLRDGEPVARRLSSIAYALNGPLPLTGAGTFGANTIVGSWVLDYDDPLNPFKHRYHPDHNNLSERFDQKLPEGQESFTIQRELALEFSATDPELLPVAGWGDNQLGGVYREKMTGVHKRAIFMQGIFRISRASRVPVLNDGL